VKVCPGWSLLTAVLLCAVAVAVEGQSVYAVDREQVNVRQDATTQSARVAVLRQGEQVVEMRRVGQWMQVRMPDGALGWIHSQLLRPRLLVEGEGLRLRSGPAATSTSVTMLFRGQEVTRLSQSGGWTRVELQNGRKGWLSSQYVRAKTEVDLRQERPGQAGATVEVVRSSPSPPETTAEPSEPASATLQRDPYAEGLQHEAGGDYALALDSFLEVLAADPDQVNALVHAAQGHRKLGEYDQALEKLYRALQLTGGRKDVYLTLGEIHRLQAAPDSAAKYQALFRGDPIPETTDGPADAGAALDMFADTRSDAVPSSPLPKGTELDDLPKPKIVDEETGGLSFDTPWLPVGLAGIGLLALAGVGWWVVNTSTHRTKKGAAVVSDPRFEKVWSEESRQARHGKATTEEEAELDHQIDDRWGELKESAAAFAPPPVTGEGVDGILDQVEGLRRTLEGQDERVRIYADIVRLQNMKIDAMTEEISRLRKA
jgi:SH3-like domain-containing protein